MIKQFEEAMKDQKSRHIEKSQLLEFENSELEADLALESQLTAQKRDEMLETKKELNLLDKKYQEINADILNLETKISSISVLSKEVDSKCQEFEWQIYSCVKQSKSQKSVNDRKSENGGLKYVEKEESGMKKKDSVYYSMENSRMSKFGQGEEVERSSMGSNMQMTTSSNT
jgi:hypothetical protein